MENTKRKPYVIVFIGGSHPKKRWPSKSMALAIDHIFERHDLEVILCGDLRDRAHSEAIVKHLKTDPKRVLNLTGTLCLLKFCHELAGARLFLGHESCGQHLSTALGQKKQIVLYNGLHRGRFVPYPDFQGLEQIVLEPPGVHSPGETEIKIDLAQLEVSKVSKAIDDLLNSKKSSFL